jgi:hypothetical protein
MRVPRERRRPASKVGADLVVLHFCEVGRDDAKDDEEEGRRMGAPRCADTVQFVVACPQSVMACNELCNRFLLCHSTNEHM